MRKKTDDAVEILGRRVEKDAELKVLVGEARARRKSEIGTPKGVRQMKGGFFDKQTSSSRLKAEIVANYFEVWAQIISHAPGVDRIAYIDLFCGPGTYLDGSPSTPIMVLQKAVSSEVLQKRLVTVFNDKNRKHVKKLKAEVERLPGIDLLGHKPIFLSEEVGVRQAEQLADARLLPTLLFADPCGLKGLSAKLIGAVLKDFGSECILFFNYDGMNRCLGAPQADRTVSEILGEDETARLRKLVAPLSPGKREEAILQALFAALRKTKGKYVLPFRFLDEDRKRPSHYLVFATKHSKGYEMMKEIMAKASSAIEDGVASFGFDPRAVGQTNLDYQRLDQLAEDLLARFAGQTTTVGQVYAAHNLGTSYILSNYKEAFRRLEEQGRITADPPADKRPKRSGKVTFADNVTVEFPE